jgi:hypothetical protein
MLLSDRDIHTAIEGGRIQLDPLDLGLVQPASIDVRLDRVFRLFDNHRYAVIDPSVAQPELTRRVEVNEDEPFVLHPGEFVLGATLEKVALGDDVAARLEGKSSLGAPRVVDTLNRGLHRSGFRRTRYPRVVQHCDHADPALPWHAHRTVVLLQPVEPSPGAVWVRNARLPLSGTAWPHGLPLSPAV